MGLISGLIVQGAASLYGNSKAKNMHIQFTSITEKHRNYLKSKGETNTKLEEFIAKHNKYYNKLLKKL